MIKENQAGANKSRSLLFWLGIGVCLLVFIYLIRGVLLPFVLGTLIAYFLDPAADRMERAGFSRTASTSFITLLFFTGLALLSLLIIPTITSQLSGLIIDLPKNLSSLELKYESQIYGWLGSLPSDYVVNLKAAAADFSGIMLKFLGNLAGGLFQSGMAIVNILSLILITPVVAFYLLRDWDRIVDNLHSLLPRQHEAVIREQLAIIDSTLSGFIRGQINVCLLLGVFYAVGLTICGLKFSVLIGLGTGFLIILPYVGAIFGMGMGLLVAFFQFGTWEGVIPVLVVFILGQLLESNIITPKLVGEKVGLHPVWVIFGLLAGAALFGFVGVLIAVPVTAVIGVLTRFAISRYLQSGYYRGNLSI